MTARDRCITYVMRCSQDDFTGEFVNVGVAQFVPEQSLLLHKFQRDLARIKRAFPLLDETAYEDSISAFERDLAEIASSMKTKGGGRRRTSPAFPGPWNWESTMKGKILRIGRVARSGGASPNGDSVSAPSPDGLPPREISFRWSHPTVQALAKEPLEHLRKSFRQYVTFYDEVTPQNLFLKDVCRDNRSDHHIWRIVEKRLIELNVAVDLKPKVVEGRTVKIEFRHAAYDGAWRIFVPVSFDIRGDDRIRDKARLWVGRLDSLRDGVDDDIRLHFIVGKPADPMLRDAYDDAVKIMRGAPFEHELFEEHEVDEVVRRIERVVNSRAPSMT